MTEVLAPAGEPLSGAWVRLELMADDAIDELYPLLTDPQVYADGYVMHRRPVSVADNRALVRSRFLVAGRVVYAIPREQRNLGAEIVPPRVFTEEFMNRVSALPGRTDFPSDIFNGNGDVAGKLILHYAHQGARAAMPLAGAGKLAAQMRGAARGGAQAAVFIGSSALLLAGGA